MPVEIKFEANQQYQLDAITSVVELFAGQETAEQNVVDLGLGMIATPKHLEPFEYWFLRLAWRPSDRQPIPLRAKIRTSSTAELNWWRVDERRRA